MFDITQLGFTKEELQERVVDRICEQVMTMPWFDNEGEELGVSDSHFNTALKRRVQERIDSTISALAEKHVLPNVAEYIENLTIQTTNQYGEQKGEPLTFIEYLVKRAGDYMTEQVDSNGKSKGTDYNWRGVQTRITYLVNSHLQYSIETAMKQALANANSHIVQGIEATVKQKLSEVAASLKVEVKTGR